MDDSEQDFYDTEGKVLFSSENPIHITAKKNWDGILEYSFDKMNGMENKL